MTDGGEGRDGWGPTAATMTPPIAALATVAVAGEPLTTLDVAAGNTLAVHVAADDREGDMALDDDAFETGETPAPEFADDLGDPAETVTVSTDSWLTVTAGDERRLRVSTSAGETVAVYLEAAEGDL